MTSAFAFAALLYATSPCQAQILQGQWVDATEQAIEKYRKTDIAVIVLDRDDHALQGVDVQIEQLRHDFVVGLTVPADRMPPTELADRPVYRCFNGLSMDRLNDWAVKPDSAQPPASALYQRWEQAIKPIHTTFGRVISADAALNADELSLLVPKDLQDVLIARVDYAIGLKPGPDNFDLYCDLLHRNMIERKLGHGMAHRLFERAYSKRPKAQLSLRFRDAITFQWGRAMLTAVQKLEIRQVGYNAVTIEQRFRDQVNPHALERMLDDTVGKLKVPVKLAGLEVGGATPIAAGLNIETVLRCMFAQPNIKGIYFAGTTADDLIESNAALIDAEGMPTAAGEVLEGLFRVHWWSSETLKTDERGNAESRLFTGWHRVTATLPNGKHITSDVYVPKSDRRRLIVLQATAAEAKIDG